MKSFQDSFTKEGALNGTFSDNTLLISVLPFNYTVIHILCDPYFSQIQINCHSVGIN